MLYLSLRLALFLVLINRSSTYVPEMARNLCHLDITGSLPILPEKFRVPDFGRVMSSLCTVFPPLQNEDASTLLERRFGLSELAHIRCLEQCPAGSEIPAALGVHRHHLHNGAEAERYVCTSTIWHQSANVTMSLNN